MKIVYIVKYIAQLGGLDRVLSDKMNYLAEHYHHDVYLITYEQGKHPFSYSLSPKIKHTDLNVRFFTRHGKSLVKRFLLYLKMRRQFRNRLYSRIREIHPDVVVTLTDSYSLSDILMNIPGTFKRIVESHVERNSFLKANDFSHSFILNKVGRIYDAYFSRQFKKCDRMVVLTEKDAAKWKKDIPQTIVIPNPVTLYPEVQSALTAKTVISAGRLELQKGYDLLIKAWNSVHQKHPDWKLTIYGDGGCRTELENLIAQSGLSGVVYLYPATKDIYHKYIDSSIYVMSSRYEGFGLVLIEAMSCGIPCVSFDCPHGPSDIITNYKNGILVENANLTKLSESICLLIENEELRRNMGKNARESIKKYLPQTIMPQWEELFHT